MATETEDEKRLLWSHIISHKTIFGILSIHILLKKMDGKTNSFEMLPLEPLEIIEIVFFTLLYKPSKITFEYLYSYKCPCNKHFHDIKMHSLLW